MSSLSDRQRRILVFIMDFTEVHDYPPTIREIGEEVGITSTSVVNYNLAKLEDMNLLTRQREVSRGLSLNRAKLADMGITGANGGNGTVKLASAPPCLRCGGGWAPCACSDLGQDCSRQSDPG